MSSKSGGTQGYRYYMSLLSGLCRGPVNEVCEIRVGDKEAWTGHACSNARQYIDNNNLFGGDDKEGGIQGPFRVYMGAKDQVLLGAVDDVPDLKGSIGGRVSEMRGVVTLWYDGLVSAMSPYLKEWKFRVRRSTSGWYDAPWYPEKATIYLGGDNLTVATNRPIDFPITNDTDAGTFTLTLPRNTQEGDTFTINGLVINIVTDKHPANYDLRPAANIARMARSIANVVNANSAAFHAMATYTDNTVTFAVDKAGQDIYAMNASHIVYECYTNPEWGRGLPASDIDEPSFIYAANKLCAEAFGICLIWYRKEDIDQFITKICDLVGGVSYTDRETGKIVFRLIRNDYDINDLPLFTPETGLISITDDDSASSDNSYNEIIGTSTDPVSNLDFQVRAQNLAGLQSQGAISTLDQDYKGIPTKLLLQTVVLRDLRAMGSGLKKYAVSLDRRGWRVAPGSCIRISHPGRGLTNVVLRVGEIDDGNMVNGEIKIKAAIDVFGLPATVYQGVTTGGWVAPSRVAAPAQEERFLEAGFRDFLLRRGAGDASAAQPATGYVGQLAVAPNATSLEYDLITKAMGEATYTDRGRGAFTGNAYLVGPIGPLDTAITFVAPMMFDGDNVGQALLIDDELVRLDGIDTVAKTATISRGVGDSVPAAHVGGSILWTIDDDLVGDGQTYDEGETVYAKVLTRTSAQLLDPDVADEESLVIHGRIAKPYPPADVKVGGISIYANVGQQPEPVITWAERNRVTQAEHLFGHTEATVAPEAGTTYTIRIYKPDNTLLRTVDGLTDPTFTYDATMQAADSPTSTVLVELESKRDDLVSWQHYRFSVALTGGWGYGWGYHWGS